MIEKQIDVKTDGGGMDTFVTHPEEGGPFPAVIVLMDIWGFAKSCSTRPQDRGRR